MKRRRNSKPKVVVAEAVNSFLAEGVAEMKSWNVDKKFNLHRWRGISTLVVVATLFFSVAVPNLAQAEADAKGGDPKAAAKGKGDGSTPKVFNVYRLKKKGNKEREAVAKELTKEDERASVDYLVLDGFDPKDEKSVKKYQGKVGQFVQTYAGKKDFTKNNEIVKMVLGIRHAMNNREEKWVKAKMDEKTRQTKMNAFKENLFKMFEANRSQFRRNSRGTPIAQQYLDLLKILLNDYSLEELNNPNFLREFFESDNVKELLGQMDLWLSERPPSEEPDPTAKGKGKGTEEPPTAKGKGKGGEKGKVGDNDLRKQMDAILAKIAALEKKGNAGLDYGKIQDMITRSLGAGRGTGERGGSGGKSYGNGNLGNFANALNGILDECLKNRDNDDDLADKLNDLQDAINRVAAEGFDDEDDDNNNGLEDLLGQLAAAQQGNDDNANAAQPPTPPVASNSPTPPQSSQPSQALNEELPERPEEPEPLPPQFAVRPFTPVQIGNEEIDFTENLEKVDMNLFVKADDVITKNLSRRSLKPMVSRAENNVRAAIASFSAGFAPNQLGGVAMQMLTKQVLDREARPLFNKKRQLETEKAQAVATLKSIQTQVAAIDENAAQNQKLRLNTQQREKLDELEQEVETRKQQAKSEMAKAQAALEASGAEGGQAQLRVIEEQLNAGVENAKQALKKYKKRINAGKEDAKGQQQYQQRLKKQLLTKAKEIQTSIPKIDEDIETLESGISSLRLAAQPPRQAPRSSVPNIYGNRSGGGGGVIAPRGAVPPRGVSAGGQNKAPTTGNNNQSSSNRVNEFRTRFTGRSSGL